MNKWLSIAELSRQANIPDSTTRRYLTRFSAFFRYEDRSRGRRYHPDSLAVVVRIQTLYHAGSEANEIEEALVREFPINVDDDREESAPLPVAPYATKEDIGALYELIEVFRTEFQQAKKENEDLRALIKAQQEHVHLERKVLYLQEELAASKEQTKPWWQFWK